MFFLLVFVLSCGVAGSQTSDSLIVKSLREEGVTFSDNNSVTLLMNGQESPVYIIADTLYTYMSKAIYDMCDLPELPLLTEEERAVYKRGRNSHVNSVPRGASKAEYHAATGLEAVFGYLHLAGEDERARELFDAVLSARDAGEDKLT